MGRYYRNVFSGMDAAKWFVENMEGVHDLSVATPVGQKFVNLSVFVALAGHRVFRASADEM